MIKTVGNTNTENVLELSSRLSLRTAHTHVIFTKTPFAHLQGQNQAPMKHMKRPCDFPTQLH